MSLVRNLAALAVVVLSAAAPAQAQEPQEFVDQPEGPKPAAAKPEPPVVDEKARPGYVPGYRREPSIGLSPFAPEFQPAFPGALTPAFGAPVEGSEWRLNIRGYLQAAARIGIGTRTDAAPGQSSTTLHGDPVVPGASYGWFDHSGTVPDPWTELNVIFGNKTVAATLGIAAWTVADANGSAMPNAQLWVTNAFLTYTPDVSPLRLKANVGVFADRYGNLGKDQQGAYGEVLIGSIGGVGGTVTVEVPFEGDVTVAGEAGFKGQLGKAPVGIPFDGSSDYARSGEGSTWAAHAHAALTWRDRYTLGGHVIHSWTQDDRKDASEPRDGRLTVAGVDLRADARRFGYLYLGYSHVSGENTDSLSSLVRVLNTGRGYEFDERYWGFESHGTGSLQFLGLQYTLSLGTLLRHPMDFWGEGPDLSVSVFGIYGMSGSAAPQFDDKKMAKYGGEILYSFSEYVAASVRVDHVLPDLDAPGRSYGIFSPRLIVRTGWLTRESVTLQYSYYALGSDTRVEGDRRLVNTTSAQPDRHVVALYASTWW
jgi:hypothetical protein